MRSYFEDVLLLRQAQIRQNLTKGSVVSPKGTFRTGDTPTAHGFKQALRIRLLESGTASGMKSRLETLNFSLTLWNIKKELRTDCVYRSRLCNVLGRNLFCGPIKSSFIGYLATRGAKILLLSLGIASTT